MGTDLDSDRVKEKRADKWGEKKKKLLSAGGGTYGNGLGVGVVEAAQDVGVNKRLSLQKHARVRNARVRTKLETHPNYTSSHTEPACIPPPSPAHAPEAHSRLSSPTKTP